MVENNNDIVDFLREKFNNFFEFRLKLLKKKYLSNDDVKRLLEIELSELRGMIDLSVNLKLINIDEYDYYLESFIFTTIDAYGLDLKK